MNLKRHISPRSSGLAWEPDLLLTPALARAASQTATRVQLYMTLKNKGTKGLDEQMGVME